MEAADIRYIIDFRFMPEIIANQGEDFIKNCLARKEECMCCLFVNLYGKMLRGVSYDSSIKGFKPNQFGVTHKIAENGWEVLYITLPEDPFGAQMYCTAYAVAFRRSRGNSFVFWKKNEKISDICFFTVEKSIFGTDCIGSMTTEGDHLNYGSSTGSAEGDIKRILEIVS